MAKQFVTNLSEENKLIADYGDGYFVDMPVETPATLHAKGQIVTLLPSGNVQPAQAADFPFGYVSVPNIPEDTNGTVNSQDYVTVGVFADGNYGYAKTAAVATGDLVVADGQSTVDAEFMDYLTAAGGQYAVGICVKGAAVGERVTVLLFHTPVLVP